MTQAVSSGFPLERVLDMDIVSFGHLIASLRRVRRERLLEEAVAASYAWHAPSKLPGLLSDSQPDETSSLKDKVKAIKAFFGRMGG